MGSSVAPSPVYFPSKLRLLCHHKFKLSSNPILIRSRNPRTFTVSASIAQKDVQLSWFSRDQIGSDEFNGWAAFAPPVTMGRMEKVSTLVMIGAVASVALTGVIAYISLSKKGFTLQFRSRINAIQRVLVTSKTEEEDCGSKFVDLDVWMKNAEVPERSYKAVSNLVQENTENESHRYISVRGQLQHIIVPISVDSTQQEALSVLKELKIIEDDVKADELCTRREYARWLVRANSLLERNRKHRIVPSAAISGSKVAAFNDVNIEDPDFEHIQSLAEAGIIPSNLSGGNLDEGGGLSFSPESFISREHLVSWKAQLEYGVMPGIYEKISRRNIGILDAREISSDAIAYLFMDLQKDEKSILRRTFGQSKRLQPRKPSTKAQAVVSLTSGRMENFISIELSRIKAENSSKEISMQELRSSLLEKGDIKQYWDIKMEGERVRGLRLEKAYLAATSDLEKEKSVEENIADEFVKRKAALDCQKQLLYSLKDEDNELSERLRVEKAMYIDETSSIDTLLSCTQLKYEGLLDAKSILAAEIEALRKLRSWIEDEARKNQARTKVLQEVERRWKWYKQEV